MKFLKPANLPPDQYEIIEKEINKFWEKILYIPLLRIINDSIGAFSVQNSINVVKDAILRGRIQYNEGNFSGNFNASITKELKKMGAKYDKKTGNYNIRVTNLPLTIQTAIGTAQHTFEKAHNDAIKHLDTITPEYIQLELEGLDFETQYQNVLKDLDKKVIDSLKAITIEPKMNPGMLDKIAEDYSDNLKLYIKGWTEENVLSLREKVYKNTFTGYRAENLVQEIQKNYNTSEHKAKFLAKQETNLLSATFRKERFQGAGVNEYKWRIRGFRTRPDHKRLDGKVFSWDSPPITNTKTGERNHPQQDYNCFCTAIPIARF